MASKLPTFQTQLQWGILSQPFNGSIFNGTWSGTSGGVAVQVSPTGAGSGEGLRLAYNLGEVFYSPDESAAEWTNANAVPSMGYTHPGQFNAPTNPAGNIASLQADPSIRLLGLALNQGSGNTPGMVISFNQAFNNLGFYAATKQDANFSLTIKVYSGANGSGSLLSTDTFTYNSLSYQPGGTCAAIQQAPSAPVGCNDAPFFYASGYSSGRSLVITSSDNDGFYLSGLYFGQFDGTPEPGPMILCGCGLALLAASRHKLRRKA